MGAIYKQCVGCSTRYASVDEDLCDDCFTDFQGMRTAVIQERHIPCQSVNADGSMCQNPAQHYIPYEGNVCTDHLGESVAQGPARPPGRGRSAAEGAGRVPVPPPTIVHEDSRTHRTRTRGDEIRSVLNEQAEEAAADEDDITSSEELPVYCKTCGEELEDAVEKTQPVISDMLTEDSVGQCGDCRSYYQDLLDPPCHRCETYHSSDTPCPEFE